ncbi:MAG: hypothetical protein CL933_12375 [Deltaproteobacteria bacterium]|nr:hypothetical protein [Deltaproteobacteria bacterium]
MALFRSAFTAGARRVGLARGEGRTLAVVIGFVEKVRVWCEEEGLSLDDVVASQLHDDMFPFHFQIVSASHHSLGALRSVQTGEFSPPPKMELDFAGLQSLVAEARSGLTDFPPDVVNGFEGGEVVFKLGGQSMLFAAEGFLLTFSLPNFYFYTVTAYDILRFKGAPIGKRDFLGPLKLKG